MYEILDSPPQTGIGKFLMQLRGLFKFFVANKKDVSSIGDLIKGGYFSRRVTNIDLGYTANYAFIKRYFGNASAYLAAKSYIMSRYDEYFTEGKTNNNVLPLTREEILLKIRQDIDGELLKLNTEYKVLEDKIQRSQILATKSPNNPVYQSHTSTLIVKRDEIGSRKRGLATLLQANKGRSHPVIIDVIDDIFPNWAISKNVIAYVADAYDETNLGIIKDIVEAERHSEDANISNETMIRERENEELKLSSSVKDFLSFIRVKTTDSNPYDSKNYIPSKWAFHRMMQLLTQYFDLNDITLDKFHKQLEYLKANEPIND